MEDFDSFTLAVNFLFTAILYMFGPLEVFLMLKKEIDKKQAKILAICNSIVVYLILVFIFIFVKETDEIPKGTPALFYGFINYWILTNFKGDSGKDKKDKKHS